MSCRVRLTGWSHGLKKVALTKLVRETADLPQNEAHDTVNRLLEDETVELTFGSKQRAQSFVDSARELGVEGECVEIEISAKES